MQSWIDHNNLADNSYVFFISKNINFLILISKERKFNKPSTRWQTGKDWRKFSTSAEIQNSSQTKEVVQTRLYKIAGEENNIFVESW